MRVRGIVGVGVGGGTEDRGGTVLRRPYAPPLGALNMVLQRGAHFLDTYTRNRFRNEYRLQAGARFQRASRHIVVISGPFGGLN